MKLKTYLPLTIIVFIAVILRFWKLPDMPTSLNWDEVSHGYNAYSVLKTGKDEWGVFMPHLFRAFGDYKLPIYIYLTTISVWLFDLTPFAVRFVSALAGVLAVPGIYLLAKKLTDSEKVALLSAFILSVTPWHFFISRPALEANLALTFLIYGGYFLIRYLDNKASFLPSAILFSLSLHTYNTARVFVPLLLISTFIFYKKKFLSSPKSTVGLLILTLSFGLVLFQVISGEGTARYEKLKILSEDRVYQIGQSRLNSQLPPVVARLVYNRPVNFALTFSKNYLSYFSPQFFFQTHGSQSQFAIPKTNLLGIPVFLLAILGIFIALKQPKGRANQFILLWLFLSPVAAALTLDPPQALRPSPMIPALVILAATAVVKMSKYFQYLVIAITLIFFSIYIKNYFNEYRTNYSQSWQHGYYQVMDFVRLYKNDYSKFFITKRLGEPHIFYAFYNRLDPNQIQPGTNNTRFEKSGWYWTDKIDNVYFVNDWDIPTNTVDKLTLESGDTIDAKDSILITSPDHVPVNASIVKTIYNIDNSPAFIITFVQ